LRDPILKKPFIKKEGLVEWLKVYALNSSPSTTDTKKNPHTCNPSYSGGRNQED
jgi:hypothetical protein